MDLKMKILTFRKNSDICGETNEIYENLLNMA